MSAVPSVLPESTTIASSAQDTESSAAPMCAASFSVMSAAVTFGTAAVYIKKEAGANAGPAPSYPSFPFVSFVLSHRRDLHGLVGDDGAVVVDERAQLGLLGAREVALRLEELERRRESDGEALVLGVEPLLRELARLLRGFHPLQVRVHLSGGFADLRGDGRFQIRQLRRLLLLLQLRLRERGVGLALPQRIREVQLDAPRAEVIGEQDRKSVV